MFINKYPHIIMVITIFWKHYFHHPSINSFIRVQRKKFLVKSLRIVDFQLSLTLYIKQNLSFVLLIWKESTTVIHVTEEEVSAYKDSNLFSKSVTIHGNSKMHVMKSDCTNSYLWPNSSYHKAGTNGNIWLPLPPKQASSD